MNKYNFFYFLFFLMSHFPLAASAGEPSLGDNPTASISQKLGQKIDLSLQFVDQNGKKKTLSDILSTQKALILTLNYFRCTTMCTYQFLNLGQVLKEIDIPPGKGYEVASMSFDPTDTVQQAKQSHDLWVPKTGNPHAAWNFYVSDFKNMQALTQQLNFYYEKDDEGNYSHAGALFFIAQDGTFERYLYGIVYDKSDVELALHDTSHGALGTVYDRFLSLFHKYNPARGKYFSYFSREKE